MEPLVGEIVLAVEIDGTPTHYGAVLHGREEFLPARGVLFLRNLLGEIEVVPADADRLKTAGLEQARDIFDRGDLGVVLISMPGLEKRLARYPQLYARMGFVYAFHPLSPVEVRRLLESHWLPPGVALPVGGLTDEQARAAITRITGGNFRLLHRLLTQMARLMEINALSHVTQEVVEAARETRVIGVV